jgi:gliding motility-associated-like protein
LLWGTEPVTEAPLMKLKIYASDRNGSPKSMNTFIDIRNEGNIPIDHKDVSARYWFTSEGTQPLTFSLDYAKIGSSYVTGSFTKLAPVRTNADTYLELKARPTASTFYPLTSTGDIQYRINKSDWSNFNQVNDHSYKSGSMSENAKITIYYKGQLVYGTEPTPLLAPLFMTTSREGLRGGKKAATLGTINNAQEFKEAIEATNALTPNGDGKNDTWLVKNLESGNSVKIYNRNGREVYSTKNYANDWDGTSQGSLLPEGTYYYILEVGPGKAPMKGYISIVR